MNKNLAVLKPVIAGTPILDTLTVARINAIQDAIKQLWSGENLRSGGNVQIVPSANGPTVNVLAGGGTGTSAGGGRTAFQLYIDSTGALRVSRGTVNNIVPSNIDDSFDAHVDGGVVLTVTLEDSFIGVPTSAVITRGNAPDDTKLQASVILGEVLGGKIHQYVSGSLAFAQTRYDSIDEPDAEPQFANCFGRL